MPVRYSATYRMRSRGFTRPFQGRFETWTQAPFDEPSEVAAEVKRRLGLALPPG